MVIYIWHRHLRCNHFQADNHEAARSCTDKDIYQKRHASHHVLCLCSFWNVIVNFFRSSLILGTSCRVGFSGYSTSSSVHLFNELLWRSDRQAATRCNENLFGKLLIFLCRVFMLNYIIRLDEESANEYVPRTQPEALMFFVLTMHFPFACFWQLLGASAGANRVKADIVGWTPLRCNVIYGQNDFFRRDELWQLVRYARLMKTPFSA